jgi:hypothetical protein
MTLFQLLVRPFFTIAMASTSNRAFSSNPATLTVALAGAWPSNSVLRALA